MQPTGHIAVVTGASRTRGIGAAICRALALHGTAVFFTHWTPFDEEAGFPVGDGPEALLSELQRAAPAQAMPLDLSQPEAVPQLLDAVEAWLGTPDILVNNAVYWQEAGYQDLTPEVLDRHIAINVRAPIMLSADFARRLGDRGWGRGGGGRGRVVVVWGGAREGGGGGGGRGPPQGGGGRGRRVDGGGQPGEQ